MPAAEARKLTAAILHILLECRVQREGWFLSSMNNPRLILEYGRCEVACDLVHYVIAGEV